MNSVPYENKILDFYHERGAIATVREWNDLKTRPVSPREWKNAFGGRSYKQVLNLLKKKYPVEFASIGTQKAETKVSVPEPSPTPPVIEAKKENELSPIEKLRANLSVKKVADE